jgi:hypothetical protein
MALFCFTCPDLKWQCATFFCASLLAISAAADPLIVAISGNPNTNKSDPAYFYEQVLNLALEKTRSTDGDYIITHNVHGGGIARDRAMLIADAGLHVMWASATQERQLQMRVIPIDLLKNLNNYRVLLINKDSQQLFAHVKTLDELRKFSMGSGEHWTDGTIFKDNGFMVVVTSSYSGLFKMLAARRFKFISRGLHEIGSDVAEYKDLGLIQEQTILIKYNAPVRYSFFVNKNNAALADRIERGLKIAQEDGSFDNLFYQIPSFKEGEEILKNSRRNIIEIKNTKV